MAKLINLATTLLSTFSMDLKKTLHTFSYFQYPFLAASLYFLVEPLIMGYFSDPENILINLFASYGNALFFLGIGISFTTLADTTKTHNNFSKKIWQNPKKGKFFIKLVIGEIIFFFLFGLIVYFVGDSDEFKNFGLGSIVLGVGLIGMLKTGMEYFENHRLDKIENKQKEAVKPL